jgi:dTDP-4-amino-4,6-dideoxygalactose transaminase
MYEIGQEEIDAVARVIRSGRLFRYHDASECARFEMRWAQHLGVSHARLTASGTNALTAAVMAAGIGPGDEVIIPACTYMASAVAVLGAGAIPVIVDIDETTTMDPQALADAIGPRTRAVMPVHMWGLSCDMDSIMRVATDRGLIVVEDACQAVGGAFEGRMLGSIGDVGAFSFNYYKNITCGEGGAVVTNNNGIFQRVANGVDCCGFYWSGRDDDFPGFIANSSRASEIEGAILNVQFDRLPHMIDSMRRQKKRILQAVGDKIRVSPCYSLDHECGASNLFCLDTPEQAHAFAEAAGGVVLIDTGRHVYTEWDPIIQKRGAHHDALNPFTLPQNRGCRMDYHPDTCRRSLEILGRTVRVDNHPRTSEEELLARIEGICAAAAAVTARQADARP